MSFKGPSFGTGRDGRAIDDMTLDTIEASVPGRFQPFSDEEDAQ